MKRYDLREGISESGCTCRIDEFECGDFVLFSDAQARIEALEWLVEVLETRPHKTTPDPELKRFYCACGELSVSREAARAAAGVGG